MIDYLHANFEKNDIKEGAFEISIQSQTFF